MQIPGLRTVRGKTTTLVLLILTASLVTLVKQSSCQLHHMPEVPQIDDSRLSEYKKMERAVRFWDTHVPQANIEGPAGCTLRWLGLRFPRSKGSWWQELQHWIQGATDGSQAFGGRARRGLPH